MRDLPKIVFCAFLSAAAVIAAPTPNSIQNPGSNSLPGLPNYGIAQGSVFVVYGSGMGPASLVQASGLPLPTQLGGTSLSVTVNGTTTVPLMSYTVAGQIAAILPSNTPVGTGTLTVSYGGASGSMPITVVASNFGLLTANETGAGPAIATHSNYQLITGTSSANTGETIILWGTGLGALPAGASDASAPGAVGNLGGKVTVYIGGVSAQIVYNGRNPSDPGLDQINVIVPAGVSGCNVSVFVQTGSYISNTASIAAMPSGSICSDPNGISLSGLGSTVSSTGAARIGDAIIINESVSLNLGGSTTTFNDSLALSAFQKYNATQFYASNLSVLPSIGSCSVSVQSSANPTSAITATGLDAGTSLALTGPTTATLSQNQFIGKGYYTASLASAPAGTYTVTGAGGADVGAFTASVTMPAALTWTNQAAIMAGPITRSNGVTLTWTGGDSSSFTLIEGTSINPTASGSGTIGSLFICIAPTSAGSFTIPAAILQQLPATGSATAGATGLLLFGSTSTPVIFSAPGLDYAFALTEQMVGGSVQFQ